MTNAALLAIAERCSALRELCVDMCDGVSDAGLEAVAKRCVKLEVLGLSANAVCALLGSH